MAQVPAKRITSNGSAIDYTPGSAVVAGDVVEVGSVPMVATQAIAASTLGSLACDGVFDLPKTSDTFTAGDAVYWNSSGDPVSGTAGTGAADNATGNLAGICVADAATGEYYVRTKLTAAKRTTTIGGAVTASDIEAEDATLNVNGIDAAQGGLVALAGGTSATAGNAGGAVSLTGGTGGATGNGGAASVAGGVPGATSGTGGAVAATGGNTAGLAGTNYTGGAASVTGGSGKGSCGNGGAVSVTGGVSGATGAGGAVAITSGASVGASGTAGALTIDTGAATGGTGAGITIGGTNATSITLGKMPVVPSATVAAAGSAQGDAAAIVTGITWVTAADGTKGVVLPAAAAGLICIVKNDDTANAVLKVYPNTDDTINAIAANSAISMAAKTAAVFACYDATAWFTVPLLPS